MSHCRGKRKGLDCGPTSRPLLLFEPLRAVHGRKDCELRRDLPPLENRSASALDFTTADVVPLEVTTMLFLVYDGLFTASPPFGPAENFRTVFRQQFHSARLHHSRFSNFSNRGPSSALREYQILLNSSKATYIVKCKGCGYILTELDRLSLAGFYFSRYFVRKITDRHFYPFFFTSVFDGNHFFFQFFIADDHEIGDFLHFGVADFFT